MTVDTLLSPSTATMFRFDSRWLRLRELSKSLTPPPMARRKERPVFHHGTRCRLTPLSLPRENYIHGSYLRERDPVIADVHPWWRRMTFGEFDECFIYIVSFHYTHISNIIFKSNVHLVLLLRKYNHLFRNHEISLINAKARLRIVIMLRLSVISC